MQPIVDLFTRVSLKGRQILHEANKVVGDAFFIERGAASILSTTKGDGSVEVAIVGRFGFVGVPLVLGIPHSPHRCLMSIPGEAMRIGAADLDLALQRSPGLRRILNRYVQALLVQQSQVGICNARHSLEQRLARWLLIARDRIGSDEVPVTHETISRVLGVRRAGVTIAVGKLENSGAVARGRSRVIVVDPVKLQAAACACYAAISAEYARIFDPGMPASKR